MSFFHPSFIPAHIWKWVKWPMWFLMAVAAIFVLLVLVQVPTSIAKYKDETRVPEIMAAHITLDDVLGTNLPPAPDPKKVDATMEGIDANKNGIRDDVELALFELHPDDIVLRAAQLQYAFALQMYFTKVRSEGTLVAVGLQTDRGISCVWDTVPVPWTSFEDGNQELSTQHHIDTHKISDEIEDLFYNTKARRDSVDELYRKYYKGGGTGQEPYCDISPGLLKEHL